MRLGEPLGLLEDGGNPERCGWLDDEPCVLIERAHSGLNRVLAHRPARMRVLSKPLAWQQERIEAGDASS